MVVGIDYTKNEEVIWGDGYVFPPDWGGDCSNVYKYQNHSVVHLRFMHFIVRFAFCLLLFFFFLTIIKQGRGRIHERTGNL
jgi:hypothetical protein